MAAKESPVDFDRLWRRHSVNLHAGLALALMLAVNPAAISAETVDGSPMHGALDGMVFVGTFGPAGKPGDRKDALSFDDGQFWSAICVPCGFVPSAYWIRRVGDAIHFQGEMRSVDRGTFQYMGVIRKERLSAKVHWRKHRWYWTIERDFRFEGTLSESPLADSAEEMTRRAQSAASKPEPTAVCSL